MFHDYAPVFIIGMLNSFAEMTENGIIDFDTYVTDPEKYDGFLIYDGFHDGAAGGEDEVARDGGGAVAHMLRYRWGGDALDFACVEDVPVADAAQVVAGDFLFTRI